MGHVQDRWWKDVGKDDRGRPIREKTELHGNGMRYRVRYLDPNGRERSQSFPDRQKSAAEAFLHEVETDKNKSSYLDPTAGRITFRRFAETWLAAQTFAESTRESVAGRLVRHVYPHFGDTELRAIGPAMIQAWGRRLQQQGLAETYRRTLFANVSGVFTAAIDDERIRRNPCAGKSVTRPRGEYPKVVPWLAERVHAVRAELGERYRLTVDLGAGCGLRQGEVFGLCVDQVDFADRAVQIVRQVKIVRSRLVFGPPKHGKTREVPLPDSIARVIRARREVPAVGSDVAVAASGGRAGHGATSRVDSRGGRAEPALRQPLPLETRAAAGRCAGTEACRGISCASAFLCLGAARQR